VELAVILTKLVFVTSAHLSELAQALVHTLAFGALFVLLYTTHVFFDERMNSLYDCGCLLLVWGSLCRLAIYVGSEDADGVFWMGVPVVIAGGKMLADLKTPAVVELREKMAR
jgi:hypothetical protein